MAERLTPRTPDLEIWGSSLARRVVRAEIRNFSSSVEKYFTSERSERVKYFFQHEKRNFVSPSDHVIFYLLYKHQ